MKSISTILVLFFVFLFLQAKDQTGISFTTSTLAGRECVDSDYIGFTLLDFTGKQIELGSFEFEKGMQDVTLNLASYNFSPCVYYSPYKIVWAKKSLKLESNYNPKPVC
jgi:hypothetical protein